MGQITRSTERFLIVLQIKVKIKQKQIAGTGQLHVTCVYY